MTPIPAIFGIENGTLNTVVALVLLGVAVIWLALVWYTLSDARRRLDDGVLIASAVLAALVFPFIGALVYTIVRPPEYLEDVRERELEMEAARARLVDSGHELCPNCEAIAGRDFLRCPHCLHRLRDKCRECSRPLDPDWLVCPYCEAAIPGVTPTARSRSRGRAAPGVRERRADDAGPQVDDPHQAGAYAETAPIEGYDDIVGPDAPSSSGHR
ncbi:MAG: zinc ribbon domain-containing protein [Solirubrobacteraceae bacterium]|nr:zinc ribbon domain-containing protein [Solirubrobacteraceae bacterium]